MKSLLQDKGKIKKLGSVEPFHTDYYACPNHKEIIAYGGMMGEEWLRLVRIKNGRLNIKNIGSRGVVKNMGTESEKSDWLSLRCILNNHYISADSESSWNINYEDLL